TGFIDGDGYVHGTTYDPSGFIASETLNIGGPSSETPLALTTEYATFDALGRPGSVTDPRGHETAYKYNETGSYHEMRIDPPGSGATDAPTQVVREDLEHGWIDTLTLSAANQDLLSLQRDVL